MAVKTRQTKEEKARAKAKRFAVLMESQAIVAKGVCPYCGAKLYRNNSMAGWWMCAHRGAPGFQREVGPHCDFQLFYDVTPEEHAAVLEAARGDALRARLAEFANPGTPGAPGQARRRMASEYEDCHSDADSGL